MNERSWSISIFVVKIDDTILHLATDLQRRIERDYRSSADIRVINVLDEPEVANSAGIFATPTLIRYLPEPVIRLLGDLKDSNRVMHALALNVE